MNGSEKQAAWAEAILADALDGLEEAAQQAPDFKEALAAMAEYLKCGIDSVWFIENRHLLVPDISVVYGTDVPSISAIEVSRHPLMKEGTTLQFGEIATQVTIPSIRSLFKAAWDKQLACVVRVALVVNDNTESEKQ